MKVRCLPLFGLIGLLLSGCQSLYSDAGLVHDRSKAYLASTNGKKIVLPNEQVSEPLSNTYLIPDTGRELQLASVITPPGSLASKVRTSDSVIDQPAVAASAVKLLALKSGHEIVIKQPYQQAWLSVQTALRRQRFPTIEIDKDKHFFKIADTYHQEAGLSDDWILYYLQVKPLNAEETIVKLAPLDAKQRFNQHISKRLLARVEAGIKGHYKPKGLFEAVKAYV